MGGWRGPADDGEEAGSMRRVGRLQDGAAARYGEAYGEAGRREEARRWALRHGGYGRLECAVAARCFDLGTRALEQMGGVVEAGDARSGDGTTPSQADPTRLGVFARDRRGRLSCKGSVDGVGRVIFARDHALRRGAARLHVFALERKCATLGVDLVRRVRTYTAPGVWRLRRAVLDPTASGTELEWLRSVQLLVVQIVEIALRGRVPADPGALGGVVHMLVLDAAAGEGAPPLLATGAFRRAFPPAAPAPALRSAASEQRSILAGVSGTSLRRRLDRGDFDAERHGWVQLHAYAIARGHAPAFVNAHLGDRLLADGGALERWAPAAELLPGEGRGGLGGAHWVVRLADARRLHSADF
eukprot:gene9449-5640_t